MPRLGHLNLRVADLDRAVDFYRRLGFRIVRRAPGAPVAFLGLDQPGAFQLGLSVAGEPQSVATAGARGLDHFALAYDSPGELARACEAMLGAGVEPVEAHAFGVSLSVYFEDPDGNRFELYYEYPSAEWPPEDERFRMRPLDVGELLADAGA
jgi:catechol 2,3-dioxygenase